MAERTQDQLIADAMQTVQDAIAKVRLDTPDPVDLARLLAAVDGIVGAIRQDVRGFNTYRVALLIEEATQIMREMERRPPEPRPATGLAALIARFRGRAADHAGRA